MELIESGLLEKPKTLEGCYSLIDSLLEVCREQDEELVSLRAKLSVNSSNSSSPPSMDSIKQKAARRTERDAWRKRCPNYWQKRKQGAQPGHKGRGRHLHPVEEVDEVISCLPESKCLHCLGEIINLKLCQRKQVFEIDKSLHITEYQIYKGKCSLCKRKAKGTLPADVPAGILGVSSIAKVGLLSGKYRLSKREAKEFLYDFYGLNISIGTISNAEAKVSQALKKSHEEVALKVQSQSYLHADETSHNYKGNTEWLWIASNQELTYFKIYENRNQDCAKALIGESYEGMLVTDRYGAYNWVDETNRQYCWAHLKRDFQKIIDRSSGTSALIGYNLLDVFKLLFLYRKLLEANPANNTNKINILSLIKRFCRILQKGQLVSDLTTARFCKNLFKNRKSLWHFLSNKEIEPTNNHAERQLRHAVIWRKKCYGTQSSRGTKFAERILTVFKTCKQQGKDCLNFITQSICAFWRNESQPALLSC